MKKEFSIVVRDDHGLNKARHTLANWKLIEGQTIEVVIRPYKLTRSQQQNKLMWKWLNIIGGEVGQTPQEVHEDMKRKFLKPILEAEDDNFRNILDNLRKSYLAGQKDIAVMLERQVMELSSTSMLNVKQMTAYLESILDHARSLDITLPVPEDRRRL